MSTSASFQPGTKGMRPRSIAARFDADAMAFAAGFGLFLVLTAPRLLQIASSGGFQNPDDAMRAVELRDFMAGQAWFDLVPHRLSPDHPFVMHWSRIVDVILAIMVRLFGLVLSPTRAELAVRIVEPMILFAVALRAMLSIARSLLGVRTLLPAALLLAGSLEFIANFLPGHIHHHALQATLLLVATRLSLADRSGGGRWGAAAMAGVVVAVSLGIGLQSLPFMVAIAAIFALRWVWEGGDPPLVGFGFGLAGAAVVVFLLQVPPNLYGSGACDAFSTAHLLALGIGGGGIGLLGLCGSRIVTRPARIGALAILTLVVVGMLALTYPACLGDPMAGVDPVLRRDWLADVGEALPLLRLIALDPVQGITLALALGFGVLATVGAWHSAGPAARRDWLALLLLIAVGVAGTLYQVRVAASTVAFLVPGLAWFVLRCFDTAAATPKRPALLLAVTAGLLTSGAGLAALAKPVARLFAPPSTGRPGMPVDPAACFDPAAYAALAALPPGLVLSTIDPGSTILAYTAHSALAAPYHRNSYGNRVALLALTAQPPAALAMIRDARADYIALCRTSNETAETIRLHPESLSARLMTGDVPAGLSAVDSRLGNFAIFRVDPAPPLGLRP